MTVARTELEIHLLTTLRLIAAHRPPKNLRANSMSLYGLDPDEAIEMTYENVLFEAKNATRGIRLAKVKP